MPVDFARIAADLTDLVNRRDAAEAALAIAEAHLAAARETAAADAAQIADLKAQLATNQQE